MSEASATERERLEKLLGDLERIHGAMLRLEDDFAGELEHVDEGYRESARNLLHYLTLRHEDVRPLQERLAALGLSSLGRSEAHALATVDAVSENVYRLLGRKTEAPRTRPGVSFIRGAKLLAQHTQSLLGPRPNRKVRIMVTLPTEAAADYPLVRELLDRGMDCARINTAHDDPAAWERMAANVRTAARELKRNCRIQIDLAGPKLRTGAIEPGPRVIEWHPRRDTLGRVTSPVRIWLTPDNARVTAPSPADVTLPIAGPWMSKLCDGDAIEFDDAREAARTIRITGKAEGGYWAECRQTCYVTPNTALQVRHRGITLAAMGRFGEFPPREQALILKPGETLIVTPEGAAAGKSAAYDESGRPLAPAIIPCTLSEGFPDLRPGERIWFDDGKIGGLIQNVAADRMEVLITQARAKGAKLRADKGINLPDSNLSLPALTAQDIEYLPFVVAKADLVGMSFVRRPQDVRALQAQLERLGGRGLGIVLKIETRRGFERLPNLLLALMRHPLGGVMIARGDLAVECGYERLAELQEEILWICEAAHMPVIWATQVLESLTKGGMPSRAEITDAAMGERSECVMLNKGPHMVQAVSVLDNILRRMQEHQSKKTSQLRPLHLEPVHVTD